MKKSNLIILAFLVFALFSCQKEEKLMPLSKKNVHSGLKEQAISSLSSTPFASGLISPLGMALDSKGQIWVTENGAGNNDAKISVISTTGQVSAAITGFSSIIDPFEGLPSGLNHIAIRDNVLYILHGIEGKLFTVNIGNFNAGDTPILANTLTGEDLSTYILSQHLSDPINSNVYNMTFGKTGDLYIVDAGANAIIKRDKHTKALSVFARFPLFVVPPGGPLPIPFSEPVPTGIVWDGNKFLVSTLGGFPFTEGVSKIFQVTADGVVSEYAGNLSTLTDIVLTPHKQPIILQFASFVFNPPTIGFQPMTGRILDADGNVLLGNLMFPTSLIRGEDNYFVLSSALGTVSKLKANK